MLIIYIIKLYIIIISWNINNDYRNINNKLEDILNLIKEFTPDMIGLQEVIPNLYDLINFPYKIYTFLLLFSH